MKDIDEQFPDYARLLEDLASESCNKLRSTRLSGSIDV